MHVNCSVCFGTTESCLESKPSGVEGERVVYPSYKETDDVRVQSRPRRKGGEVRHLQNSATDFSAAVTSRAYMRLHQLSTSAFALSLA